MDIDGGDVVGEEDDLVGVEFAAEFALQGFEGDEVGLEQAGDKGAGAGKGVEDVDILVGEGTVELRLEEIGDRVEHKVNHLDRGIDNSEFLNDFGEGGFEKLVVKLNLKT